MIKGINGIERISVKSTDNDDINDYTISAVRDIREDLFYICADGNCPLLGLRGKETSLEDIFIKVTNSADGKEDLKV